VREIKREQLGILKRQLLLFAIPIEVVGNLFQVRLGLCIFFERLFGFRSRELTLYFDIS